ncbi:hypothetical protein [Bradyrhizobium genosp. P]|uniref:hypothetical protein n=1 Tax=Bradyrhizobium genosp. P TaxID=83641 RepID=UPI003CF5F4BB
MFTSAKTSRPIRVDDIASRDALIRASLDPTIRAIESSPDPASAGTPKATIVVRDDGRFEYGVDQDEGEPYRRHLPALILTRRELYREPLFSNDRLIWSYKERRVSNGLRFQMLHALAVEGPMTLGDLISAVRIPRRSMAAAFAMACADLVELDDLASRPVGADTVIRCRSEFGYEAGRGRAGPPGRGCLARSGGSKFSAHDLLIGPLPGGVPSTDFANQAKSSRVA